MSEEKTPDTKEPTKAGEQLEADLTDEELTSVVGGALTVGSYNGSGMAYVDRKR